MPSVKQDFRAVPDVPLPPVASIVAPELEEMDPNPDINQLKARFDKEFFGGKVGHIPVTWSNRMTKAAGYCRVRKGNISITLSKPLLSLRTRKDLIETLLHELIHAYFYVNKLYKERHGPNFKKMMNEINQKAGTNISVYHSFHEEVRNYKQHWWQCNGVCKKYVRRAKNSPPKSTEWGWAKHQETCGGTFVKIAEPGKDKNGKPTGKAVRILGSSNPVVPPATSKKDQPAGATKLVTTGVNTDTGTKKGSTSTSVPPPKNTDLPAGSTKPKDSGQPVPSNKVQIPGPKLNKPNENQPPTSKPTTRPPTVKPKENREPEVIDVEDDPDSLLSVFKKMVIDNGGNTTSKPGATISTDVKPKSEIPVITLDDSDEEDEVILEFDEFDSDDDNECIIWL